MNKTKIQLFAISAIAAATLVACGGGNDSAPAVGASETTSISRLSTYNSGLFGVSAAEIPAYDPISQRLFVVNAQAGAIDVIDLSDPENPVLEQTLTTASILAGSKVNSVAVANGILAVAAENLTEAGELLADDGGGRQRQAAAQQQGSSGRHAKQPQQAGQQQRRADHLQAAQAEDHAAQGEHLAQGEFKAQGKQQKHHAHFGEVG